MTGRRHPTFNMDQIENLEVTANNELNPITYIAIDPGKYNGVCGYDKKFYLQFMYVVDADDMIQFLQCFNNIKVCVLENYRLFPNKAAQQIYSSMETSRVIGRVESWAELKHAELINQPSSIKVTGYKWIGKKPPSKSSNMNDPTDAHVHFMYWAVLKGHINPADLLGHANQHTGPR